MILLGLMGVLFARVQDDTYTVTLLFDRVHCDECRAEAEAIVKKAPGFKGVKFGDASAMVTLEERAPVPAFGGMPKDMGFKGVRVSLRGTVNAAAGKLSIVARGSGQTLALANPEKPQADTTGDLKKQLAGKNRFQVTGILAGKSILLETFQPTDWKD